MRDLGKWLEQAEDEVVQGQGRGVKLQLMKLQHQGVPKRHTLDVAKLAMRVNLFDFAAIILSKRLNHDIYQSDQKYLAAYAKSLVGLGNYELAKEIFERLPVEAQYEAALFYSDCLFKEWQYEKAANVLLNADTSKLARYPFNVFKVNLASAFIQSGDFKKAHNILKEVLGDCEKHSYEMLNGNCLELLGQIHYRQGSIKEAHRFFTDSEKILRHSKNLSWLFPLKWLSLCELKIKGVDRKGLRKLNHVRTLARKLKHWETLREIDFQESIFTENQELFSKCFFGTPLPAYRQHMLDEVRGRMNPVSPVNINIKTHRNLITYDFHKGVFSRNLNSFDFAGHKSLVNSLLKDLYRPRSIFEIFRDIYDEPFYNKISSPGKVYKKIQNIRLSDICKKLGLEVTSSKKFGYRLRYQGAFRVEYQLKNPEQTSDPVLREIRNEFLDSSFSCKELSNVIRMPQRSTNRWLKEKVSAGKLEKIGLGKNTRYKIKKVA